MSPAAQAVAIPTRSEIEAWSTPHLADAGPHGAAQPRRAEDAFDQHRQNISLRVGTTWEGAAKDAALNRVRFQFPGVGR